MTDTQTMRRCDHPDCIAPATTHTWRNPDAGTTRRHHWCPTHNPRRGH